MMTLFICCRMKEINLCLEAVHELGDVLSPRLNYYTLNEQQAVRLFASLILCLLHLLKRVCQEELEKAPMRIKECKDKLHKFVKDLVVKRTVIGGSVFGGEISSPDKLPKFTEKELKVFYMHIKSFCSVAVVNGVGSFLSSYGKTCLD